MGVLDFVSSIFSQGYVRAKNFFVTDPNNPSVKTGEITEKGIFRKKNNSLSIKTRDYSHQPLNHPSLPTNRIGAHLTDWGAWYEDNVFSNIYIRIPKTLDGNAQSLFLKISVFPKFWNFFPFTMEFSVVSYHPVYSLFNINNDYSRITDNWTFWICNDADPNYFYIYIKPSGFIHPMGITIDQAVWSGNPDTEPTDLQDWEMGSNLGFTGFTEQQFYNIIYGDKRYINTTNEGQVKNGDLSVNGLLSATGGNSTQWNQAYFDVMNNVVRLQGVQTINGTKNFTSPPTSPLPTIANHLASKQYVDNRLLPYCLYFSTMYDHTSDYFIEQVVTSQFFLEVTFPNHGPLDIISNDVLLWTEKAFKILDDGSQQSGSFFNIMYDAQGKMIGATFASPVTLDQVHMKIMVKN